jgi:L-cysteine:1D-myo-inositol 2-amino-2-deoxy-alpha-D-glucopyranoside ligase
MSAAHAESLTGVKPFAQTFMHAGMVALDGEKMSKSLGNLVFVSKLRQQGVDPMAIRLVLLSHHYRSDWEWFDSELEVAQTRLANWRTALSHPTGSTSPVAEIVKVMRNDLDTPSALKAIDVWAAETLAGAQLDATREVAVAIDAILGII